MSAEWDAVEGPELAAHHSVILPVQVDDIPWDVPAQPLVTFSLPEILNTTLFPAHAWLSTSPRSLKSSVVPSSPCDFSALPRPADTLTGPGGAGLSLVQQDAGKKAKDCCQVLGHQKTIN